MKTEILLIQPPTGSYRRDDRCQSRVEDQTIQVSFPPMDLAHHAAVLERAGFECAVRDYSTAGVSVRTALEEIRTMEPKAVFFSSTQPTEANDLAFAHRLKEVLPSARIVLRGESATFRDAAILQENPAVDLILRGESEETFEEVCRSLFRDSGVPLSSIAGVSFRSESGEAARTPDRPFIKDLNALPWPARHLLDQSLYRSPETGNVLTTLYTARGCPYPCIFCPAPIASGRPVRMRAVDDLIREIQHCIDEYGIREFLFHGDTFTYKKEWVMELCSAIRDAGLEVRWGCNSRVDTIDEEMLAAMKAAGCWVIGYGVESGHVETLDKIRKYVEREKIVAAFRMTRAAGIRSHAFFVFGFPWEGREHLEEDRKLALEIDPDFFDLNIAYPRPGTALETMVQEQGLFDRTQVVQGGYAVPATRTVHLSAEELDDWRKKTLLALYLRPRYIARTLLLAGSPKKTWNYLKAGVTRFFQLVAPRRRPVSVRPRPTRPGKVEAAIPEVTAEGA